MKKMILSFAMLFTLSAYAQVCDIDYTQTTPGAYPGNIANAKIDSAYSQSLTIVFPKKDANQIDYTSMKVVSVKLPLGLTWQCNEASSQCDYNPQSSEYGCVSVYGHPAESGTFPIEIKIATTNANQMQGSYTLQSNIVVKNTAIISTLFSAEPTVICETGQVNFALANPNLTYTPVPNITTGISHQWNFDNGLTSNAANPPAQTYSTVGEYNVTYKRTVDTVGFKLNSVTISAVGCKDAVGYGGPDVYIEVYNGNGVMVYSNQSNNVNGASMPLTFNNLNILMDTPPYKIKVLDDDSDNLIGTGSDNCVDNSEDQSLATNITLPGVNSFGETTNTANNQQLSFSYKINKDVDVQEDTIAINVYAKPAIPEVNQTLSNPVTLGATDSGLGYVYQWNLNENRNYSLTGSTVMPTESGSYSVTVIDEHGCYATSDKLEVTVVGLKDVASHLFEVYPNPASDQLEVRFDGVSEGKITLTNIDGKVVYSNLISNQYPLYINVSDLSTGIYTVFVESNGNTTAKRIVKQ